MPLLSMTRLQLKSIVLLPKFALQNEGVVKQLRASSGFIKGKTLLDFGLGAWTVTLWDNQEAMRQFYTTGAHLNIMPTLSDYSNEAATCQMSVDDVELPDWRFVHEKLSTIGKFSLALKQPTQNHLDKKIRMPRVTVLTRIILPH